VKSAKTYRISTKFDEPLWVAKQFSFIHVWFSVTAVIYSLKMSMIYCTKHKHNLLFGRRLLILNQTWYIM